MRRHADGHPILLDLLAKVLYVDRAGGAENCVFVAGGGRSGTTWVMELINASRDHRVIFEPFASDKVRFLPDFHRQQYVRREDDDAATAAAFDRIVEGRYRSWWTDQHNRTFICHHRLIKAIRANLCLGYLRQRYPRMPIVLLVRHPCAAACSMTRLGYGRYPMSVFLNQPELVEDHLAPYVDLIRSTVDEFDGRVLRWCIQHKVLFSQLEAGDVHLMFYEELCDDPHGSFEAMFSYLGRPYDEVARRAVHRPSRLSGDHSAILGGSPSVDAWRGSISAGQLERAMGFLDAFGLSDVYGASVRPDRRAVEARLTANATRRSS
jgi:hypothetical protein